MGLPSTGSSTRFPKASKTLRAPGAARQQHLPRLLGPHRPLPRRLEKLIDGFVENVDASETRTPTSSPSTSSTPTVRTSPPTTTSSTAAPTPTPPRTPPPAAQTRTRWNSKRHHIGPPTCLTDARSGHSSQSSSHEQTAEGDEHVYYLLTPPGVTVCLDTADRTGHCSDLRNKNEESYENSFCSYHADINPGGLETGDGTRSSTA